MFRQPYPLRKGIRMIHIWIFWFKKIVSQVGLPIKYVTSIISVLVKSIHKVHLGVLQLIHILRSNAIPNRFKIPEELFTVMLIQFLINSLISLIIVFHILEFLKLFFPSIL